MLSVAGDLCDLILVFFDPMGQALCKRTLNIVECLNEKHGEKLRFYLSKADEAGGESDRQVNEWGRGAILHLVLQGLYGFHDKKMCRLLKACQVCFTVNIISFRHLVFFNELQIMPQHLFYWVIYFFSPESDDADCPGALQEAGTQQMWF